MVRLGDVKQGGWTSLVWLGDVKQGGYQTEISLAKEIAKDEGEGHPSTRKFFAAKTECQSKAITLTRAD
jgi:hypothetical protein